MGDFYKYIFSKNKDVFWRKFLPQLTMLLGCGKNED